jgi:predicted transcriptional regulator
MKLQEIVEKMDLEVKTCPDCLEREVAGGYAGDMLSDVLANSKKGEIWVTLQTHLNIVAVACTKEIAGIILVNGRVPAEDTVKKAEEEKIPIMISKLPAFKLIGELYLLGVGR